MSQDVTMGVCTHAFEDDARASAERVASAIEGGAKKGKLGADVRILGPKQTLTNFAFFNELSKL